MICTFVSSGASSITTLNPPFPFLWWERVESVTRYGWNTCHHPLSGTCELASPSLLSFLLLFSSCYLNKSVHFNGSVHPVWPLPRFWWNFHTGQSTGHIIWGLPLDWPPVPRRGRQPTMDPCQPLAVCIVFLIILFQMYHICRSTDEWMNRQINKWNLYEQANPILVLQWYIQVIISRYKLRIYFPGGQIRRV